MRNFDMTKLSLRMRVLLALVVLAAVAVQVFAPSVQTQAAAEKVLKYSLGGEPSAFDPQQANFTGDVAFTYAVWRGLLRFDPASKTAGVIAAIATEIPTKENGGVSADGLTYTFHLRDWKWSDGKGVVTAQDFVYSYERLVDPAQASAYGGYLNGIVQNAQEIQDG